MKKNFDGHARIFGASLCWKVLVPVLALLTSAAAFSQSPCSAPVDRKEINITEVFNEVEVKGEITIILTAQPAGEITVEGNANDLNAVKASVKKGRLVIEADKRKCPSKMTVFVSANNVDTLIINKGLLLPHTSTTSRLDIPNTKGLFVYDTTTHKDYYNIRYESFVPALVKAIQELNKKIEELQDKNAELRYEIKPMCRCVDMQMCRCADVRMRNTSH